MTTIKPTTGPTCCSLEDVTPPMTPAVRLAIASEGVAKKGSQFRTHNPPRPTTARRDPIYLELGNHEVGTRYEVVNLSNHPASSFDDKDAVKSFEPTGRDLREGIASVFIPNDVVEKMNWDAGDHLMIRAVDTAGNASAPARAEIQGANYGSRGRILEPGARSWVPGSQIDLLDGEGRKRLLLKHIADQKAPVTRFLEKAAQLATQEGHVTFKAPQSVEPNAQVTLRNARTQQTWSVRANAQGEVEQNLGKDIKDGDTLLVFVRDNAGNEGKPAEIRYGAACKDGRASTLGVIAARLPGVIGQ